MNQWSERRRRIIFLLTLLAVVVLIGVPAFFFFHKTPTCTDGQKNGDEAGVDCGGSCKLLCKAEAIPILMKGDPRVLKVSTSTYEVVIRAENPNVSAKINRAGYVLKIYEASSSVPLKIINGVTFVPKGSNFVVFEGPFVFTDTIPARAIFEWKVETLQWEKDTNDVPDIVVREGAPTRLGTEPQLEATVKNNSLVPALNLEFTALINDANGNIIGASKTFIDRLQGGESAPLVFTWPAPFVGSSTAVEIIPRILPDRSYLR